MRVILRAVFGLNQGTRYQQLERLLATMLDRMSNPLSVSLLFFPVLRQDLGRLSPWSNFVRTRRQIAAKNKSATILQWPIQDLVFSRRSFFADTPYADTVDLFGCACAALGSLAAI
jgi:hypothetical protein